MNAEIICVGTELLLGDILNRNAQFLARHLAELGIPHYYQTVVGDNPTRIQQVVAVACARSQLLIFTGGLGPTPDDLTTETLADFFNASLVERPEIIADIQKKFAARGRHMADSNRKQALLPEGANILPNPTGSAPGMIWQPRSGISILTFPGVPSEMQRMWRDTAVPYLRDRGWGQETICSRTLRHWGIPESVLAEKVSEFFDSTNPTVAPYASKGEVKLRISARAESEAAALQLIAPVEQKIRQIAGLDCYGSDEDTLASVVGKLLQTSQGTLGVAESCTGGALGEVLTSIPGSSTYFLGGIISYSNAVKINFLGVDPNVLEQEGAVSHAVAQQMAAGARANLGATWGLGITGIAGPGGGTDVKPIGLVYIGVAGPDESVESFEYRFGATRNRDTIRHLSICYALDRLRRKLLQLN